MILTFRQLPQRFIVCRISPDAPIPGWIPAGSLVSITRTEDELSIVCLEPIPLPDVKHEAGWVALKLEGPFPFTQTGVLASFLKPLAEDRIPIFAISTFDTDYILIKQENLESALRALQKAGHELAG
jgi:uncharacterized protein